MDEFLRVLEKYGFELSFSENVDSDSVLRDIKTRYGTNKSLKMVSEITDYIADIKISDVEKIENKFGLFHLSKPMKKLFKEDTVVIFSVYKEGGAGEYKLAAYFDRRTPYVKLERKIEADLKENPLDYGWQENELKLIEAFDTGKKIDQKIDSIMNEYEEKINSDATVEKMVAFTEVIENLFKKERAEI